MRKTRKGSCSLLAGFYRLPKEWRRLCFQTRLSVSHLLVEGPCDHHPWCIGPNCTCSPGLAPPRHGTWGPPWPLPPPWTWDLVTSGGHDWRPVQTCSLQNHHLQWHLVAVEVVLVTAIEKYESCWNAFLLFQANLLTLPVYDLMQKNLLIVTWFSFLPNLLCLRRKVLWNSFATSSEKFTHKITFVHQLIKWCFF